MRGPSGAASSARRGVSPPPPKRSPHPLPLPQVVREDAQLALVALAGRARRRLQGLLGAGGVDAARRGRRERDAVPGGRVAGAGAAPARRSGRTSPGAVGDRSVADGRVEVLQSASRAVHATGCSVGALVQRLARAEAAAGIAAGPPGRRAALQACRQGQKTGRGGHHALLTRMVSRPRPTVDAARPIAEGRMAVHDGSQGRDPSVKSVVTGVGASAAGGCDATRTAVQPTRPPDDRRARHEATGEWPQPTLSATARRAPARATPGASS